MRSISDLDDRQPRRLSEDEIDQKLSEGIALLADEPGRFIQGAIETRKKVQALSEATGASLGLTLFVALGDEGSLVVLEARTTQELLIEALTVVATGVSGKVPMYSAAYSPSGETAGWTDWGRDVSEAIEDLEADRRGEETP